MKSRAELVEERRGIQSCLSSLGHDPGPADGVFGPRTRQAIASWRNDRLLAGHDRGGGNLSTGEVAALLEACGLDAASPAAARDAAGSEPACTGETGSGCWQEVANRPGCQVWNPHPQEEETVTWSGACADGRPSGTGELTWRYTEDGQSKTTMGEGSYVDGQENGRWVLRLADGGVREGPYVDGEMHGRWVWRWGDDYCHVEHWQYGRIESGSDC